MAKLSNINGRFAVEDDGAIQFNGSAGVDGEVLESRGPNLPPVWTDRDTGRVTGSGAANRVTYWSSGTNLTSDAGFTYNGAGRVNTDESFGVSKDGADTVADGPFFRLTNAVQDRQYLNQLDASNNIDYWYYNGTAWTQTISLLTDGGATFAGNVTVGANTVQNGTNPGLKIQSTNTSQTVLGLHNTTTRNWEVACGGSANSIGAGSFYIYDNTAADARLEIDTSGNTTFTGMITVNGNGIDIDNDDDVRLRFDNASTFKAGLQVATTAGDMIAGSAVNDFAIRAQANMLFATGGNTERMRITSGGDILMGNTVVNPASGFATQKGFGYDAGTGQTQIATTDNASTLVLGRNNATDGSIIDLRKESVVIGTFGSNTTGGQTLLDISANATNGNMRFLTANAERMRIDSVGVLNFSNTATSTGTGGSIAHYTNNFMYIRGGTGGLAIGDDGFDTSIYLNNSDNIQFQTGSSEKMRINSQGQMWLGGTYTGSDIANGNTTYMNNLNAGSFSILHRNSSDVYVHFNSYYTSSNTYVSKYSGRGFMLGYNAAADNGFFFSKAPNTTAGQNQTFSQVMTVGYGTSNNVGIGTTSPGEKLEVNGVIQIKRAGDHPAIRFIEDTTTRGYIGTGDWAINGLPDADLGISSASTGSLVLGTNSGNGRVYIIDGGNVGIGTDSPSANLHVSSTSTATLKVGTTGVADASVDIRGYDAGVHIGDATNGLRWAIWNDGPSTSSSLKFGSYALGTWYADSSQVVTMKSDGKVGIGTTSPSTKLHVSGSFDPDDALGYALIQNTSTGGSSLENAGINVKNHRGTSQFMQWEGNGLRIGSRILTNSGVGDVYFTAGADSVKMVIKAGGKVGIGTTATPGRMLEVNGGTTQDGGIRLTTSNTTASFWSGIEFKSTVATSFIYMSADDADGTLKFLPDASLKGSLSKAGTWTVAGDVVAYGSPSDKRLKENIKPIESALDKVSKLQGVTFDWIQKEDQILDIKEDIGFIAQDVQKVIPELVRENDNGMLSMRHQGIAPILLEAIKELKAEIEKLKSNKCNCNK